MTAIRTTSADEFAQHLNALAYEIVAAGWHLKLHKSLREEAVNNPQEFEQSPSFWNLTFSAHLDCATAKLCKIYDQNNHSLNLKNFLDTIKQNLEIFDIANFKDRLKDNVFVESLSQTSRKPDSTQLENDIFRSSNNNPIVQKLTIWRNNLIAHRSPDLSNGALNLTDQYPILISDLEELVNEARIILNRYNNLFNATTQSSMLIGQEDFKIIISSVKQTLANYKERQQEMLAAANSGRV